MCGLAGWFGVDGYRDWRYDDVFKMIQYQAHRGPDDQGFVGIDFEDNRIEEGITRLNCNEKKYNGVMGFARLSIRDLSMNAHQPMVSKDRNVVLCFNGEIYNADEYRKMLIEKGYHFISNSDTEVVLHMYREYGVEVMAEKLNGMFGIVIFDMMKRCLFLIRDRVGIKPLYYTKYNNNFAFASEVKSFLALKDYEPEVDFTNVAEAITFNRPAHNILLKGVEQVRPGHILYVNLDEFATRDIMFFDIDAYERPKDSKFTREETKNHLKDKLMKVTDNQKVSDVKVGCQLSGGVDSSLITYAAATCGKNRLRDTISIVFDNDDKIFSEEKYVNIVNEGLSLNAYKNTMTSKYVLKNYEKVIWHSDTVIGRPNSLGLFMISEEAKKHVTVLLSGEGADEVLGGYDSFKNGKMFEEILRRNGGPVEFEHTRGQKETLRSFAEFVVKAHQKTNGDDCRKIMPGYNDARFLEERIDLFDSYSGSNFDKQIKYAVTTYLPELLVSQDKMSMANSIENRVPFLDNDFMDFAFSIPETMLLQERDGELQGKFLLKQVSEEIFGAEFSYRKKMGFPFPFYNYFKEVAFAEYFYDVIVPGTRQRGIFDAKVLEEMYDKLEWKNPYGLRELFWKAFGLEIWCRMFIDGKAPESII